MARDLIPTNDNVQKIIASSKCDYAEGLRGVKIVEPMELQEWAHLLNRFLQLEDAIQFIIGDLIAYGSKNYEHSQYEEVMRLTGKKIGTLQNWEAVCKIIPPEARIYNLTFGHYQVVYTLDSENQHKFLSLAQSNKFSVYRLREEVRLNFPQKRKSDRFGKPIQLKGLRHAPINEQGVVFLFGILSESLGFDVEAVQQSFPDCIAKRRIGGKRTEEWRRVRIEFEFKSSDFKKHRHDPKYCDLIVCWKHDWKECPLEILELKKHVE